MTGHSYATLNHLFIAGTGPSLPAEYEVPGHVAEEVMRDIASWILARLRSLGVGQAGPYRGRLAQSDPLAQDRRSAEAPTASEASGPLPHERQRVRPTRSAKPARGLTACAETSD